MCLGFLLCCGFMLGVLLHSAISAEPQIYKIEPFGTNQVLVHFDTEPYRTYVLQSINVCPAGTNFGAGSSNGVPPQAWSNVYTGFAFPFPNHYIVADTRTSPQRFYRLSVTP